MSSVLGVVDSMLELLFRAITLRDYNTRIVLGGTTLLGISSGLVGTFLVLRKRALAADVVSHSALPGIAIAFLVAERLSPGSGRSSSILLIGAFVSSLLGMGMTMCIRRWTRIKDDAALAIVLGLFFGLGMALFTVVQRTATGNAAGLQHFIFGKAASIVAADVWLIAEVSAVVTLLCCALFKELSLLCFDEEFAAARGYHTFVLDGTLTLMAVTVTLIGLQSVGLLLVVALHLIPPTAARFWTHHLKSMALIAAAIGGLSCGIGVLLSAAFPRLAAGAVIVLSGAVLFVLSLLFGRSHGLWPRWRSQREFEQKIGRSDLLRACFEYIEPLFNIDEINARKLQSVSIPPSRLLNIGHWPESHFQRLTASAEKSGLLRFSSDGWQLTMDGAVEAMNVTRQHRLWELYLLTQTDLDPRLVDRGADGIEHALDSEQLARLEGLLSAASDQRIPPSPHVITGAANSDST